MVTAYSATQVAAALSSRMEADALRGPFAHRIVGPGQPPGEMGVEALDTVPGTPHPSRRPRPPVVRGDEGVPLGCVTCVRGGDPIRRHRGLGLTYPACRLDP